MELTIILVVVAVVALIWFTALPEKRRPRRNSESPRLWDGTPHAHSAAWFSSWTGGGSDATHHGSGHSHNDGSHHHGSSDCGHDGGGCDGGGH